MRVLSHHRWRLATAAAAIAAVAVTALVAPASAGTVFSDNFESGTISGWSKSGGDWSITTDGSKVLRQSNSGSGNARQFNGSTSWADYTVTARVKPLSLGSNAAAGLLARVISSTKYYRLALLPGNKAELQAVDGSSHTVLGSASRTVTTGTWYTLSITASGSTISASINGIQFASTENSLVDAGRVGLQTLYSSAAFDDVTVTTGGTPPSPSGSATPSPSTSPTGPPVPGPDSPVGYASMNGGTTGGFGAAVMHKYTLSQYWPTSGFTSPGDAMYDLFKQHDDRPSSEGLVIYVDTTIRASEFSDDKMHVNDVENVSILGVGNLGEFEGVGLSLRNSHNVVIRNLKIHHVDTGERDGITVQKMSTNVWIDHNEIYNVFPNVDKDYYDGLIDIKDGAAYVTVSWNHLHDSWKMSLTAGGDSQSSAGDYITFMNNWFQNVNSRVPLIRRSHVHMLNNFFQDVADTAINSRMGAQVLVEGNYFQNVGTGAVDEVTGGIHGPVGWFYGSNTTGYWNLVNNVYINTPHAHLVSTTSFTVPYGYNALSPQDAKTQAMQNTGAGVIVVTP